MTGQVWLGFYSKNRELICELNEWYGRAMDKYPNDSMDCLRYAFDQYKKPPPPWWWRRWLFRCRWKWDCFRHWLSRLIYDWDDYY